MAPHNELLIEMPNGYCLAQPGSTYAIYDQHKGKGFQLDLNDIQGEFSVEWVNPREVGPWSVGSVKAVQGGQVVSLGQAPGTLDKDWMAVVRKKK